MSLKSNSPSLWRPASMVPGQYISPGTRTPPSQVDPLAQRNGVKAASGQVSMCGPLSDEMKISVSSSWPDSRSAATRRPMISSSSSSVSL